MALNSCDVPTSVTTAPGSSALPADIDFSGRETRIVDGDTFWISGQDVRIRVWGRDAPSERLKGMSWGDTCLPGWPTGFPWLVGFRFSAAEADVGALRSIMTALCRRCGTERSFTLACQPIKPQA
ncbi:hypothetical protein BG454_03715 [Roseinatronobacter bogoriensis subsp. barguzinensis]|uniref:Uncharacterized protein n=1 Tax=Roseinatronobacter bogoriensis subsp. barguzinensis TaxID=441209 RepID=A0A2K8K6G7_9RHOB|nr:hypothetical protein BG454_03715 [Rhodobaca barguzinensis]